MKKRKEFNAVKQRALDENHHKMLEAAQQKMSYYESAKLNQKWKAASSQFRAAIQAARTGKPVD
jgi:hypothetical protein